MISSTRVQGGRRPSVLVISDSALPNNPMVMIVPLTKNRATTRFPFTFEIQPSSRNGLTDVSVALVFQLCATDRTLIDRIIGELENHHLSRIDEMIKELLAV
jgi:mRNA-degrading endonuclease toxin of MazEF toxin-antitoxin module